MEMNTNCCKTGPEVVLAACWHPTAEMMSPFHSPTQFCLGGPLKIFVQLTVQKLFECSDLAGNLASRFQNLEFLGVLTVKCNSV
jgi:hypothetical protein